MKTMFNVGVYCNTPLADRSMQTVSAADPMRTLINMLGYDVDVDVRHMPQNCIPFRIGTHARRIRHDNPPPLPFFFYTTTTHGRQ
eukprot:scaffold326813_cov24-Attheya_sp.AAC.1